MDAFESPIVSDNHEDQTDELAPDPGAGYNSGLAQAESSMAFKLEDPNWRFRSPGPLPHPVTSNLYDLALEISTQGPRKEILEGFKYRFSNGKSGTSSSTDYAAYDLRGIMDDAASNAPKFIMIFADYCEELKKEGKEVPDTDFLNEIFDEHNAGYQILGNEVVSTADVIVRTKVSYPGRPAPPPEPVPPATVQAPGAPVAKAPASKRFPVKVFLCHSSTDKAKVKELYDLLKGDGFDPWLDAKKLKPGQHWETEIKKAVKQTHVFVVCLSKVVATKAGFAQKEIKFALDVAEEQPEGTIFVIPAFLEPCTLPDRLSEWHWVRLYEDDGYEKLVDSLDHRAKDLT